MRIESAAVKMNHGQTIQPPCEPARHGEPRNCARSGDGVNAPSIAATVLAAGEASRYGAPKQTLGIDGVPMVRCRRAGRGSPVRAR